MSHPCLSVLPAVRDALAEGRAVVALESTLISHGLPWPDNLACARQLEDTVRAHGAEPATIGLVNGRIKIGLDPAELEQFARARDIAKVSRRDLATVLAGGGTGATTVSATMYCAHLAGIRVFATGGIGGVHRGAEWSFDVSADLTELGRTPVAVVCAGAKSILDLPKTLEVLETWGVPVLGYGTDRFPAFYVRETTLPVDGRVDTPAAAARLIQTQFALGLTGLLIAVPIPAAAALPEAEVEGWLTQALQEAVTAGVTGKALTPFLLGRVGTLSAGRTLQANLALVNHNAATAAAIAAALSSVQS